MGIDTFLLKFLVVSGARPQFIKLAPVIKALKEADVQVVHVHTGQHYDPEMSEQIFSDLELSKPEFNLEVGSGSHATQTSSIMKGLEGIMQVEAPDAVLVPGDTNSTIAGALTAVKLGIPVVHLEAGLRSHDWQMPEEINRIVTDRLSSLLICHTETGLQNLLQEGIDPNKIVNVGDPMVETIITASQRSKDMEFPQYFENYLVLTMHRAENVDILERMDLMRNILKSSPLPIIFPIHPRTRKMLSEFDILDDLLTSQNVMITKPMGYLEFAYYLQNSDGIITDSGGLQKEAFILKKPCITIRTTSEWVESINMGANRLVGFSEKKITEAIQEIFEGSFKVDADQPYGSANSGKEIAQLIIDKFLNGQIILENNIGD